MSVRSWSTWRSMRCSSGIGALCQIKVDRPLTAARQHHVRTRSCRDGYQVRRGNGRSRLARAASLFPLRRPDGRYGGDRNEAMTAKAFEDRKWPGDWRVEWIDEDIEVAIFSGPSALARRDLLDLFIIRGRYLCPRRRNQLSLVKQSASGNSPRQAPYGSISGNAFSICSRSRARC
jgi:hypothetical protein